MAMATWVEHILEHGMHRPREIVLDYTHLG